MAASQELPETPEVASENAWLLAGWLAPATPEATAIMIRLYVDRQAADARCWIDGVFIGK